MSARHVTRALLLIAVAACSATPAPDPALRAATADARGELQRLIDTCASAAACPAVYLEAGIYTIQTPPPPRTVALLDVRVPLIGAPGGTTIRCVGDTGGLDWRCLQVRSAASLRRLRIETDLSSVAEQTHAIRVDGPAAGVVLADLSIDHPTAGGGDAIQIVGYSPDRLVTELEIGRVEVTRSSRSGIAIHSGLHRARLHHLAFSAIADQSIDGEGSGDTEDVTIDHVTDDRTGPTTTSIQVMSWTRLRITDAALTGGVDLYGCADCLIADSRISQARPTADAVLAIRKASPVVTVRDTTIERMPGAGAAPVVAVSRRIGSPRDVVLVDVSIVQHAPAVALHAIGVDGLRLSRVSIGYDGPPIVGRVDAVQVTGATDRVLIEDTRIGGAYRAAVLSASAGSLTVDRSWMPLGVRCEQTGPVVIDGAVGCP